MLLSVKNPHPLDELLTFNEEAHVYTYVPTNEAVRISVSGILGRFFPNAFDGPAVARKYYDRWSNDPTSKYHALCSYLSNVQKLSQDQAAVEICRLWEETGRNARDKGTEMHKTLEDYLNGVWKPPPPLPGGDGKSPGTPPHEIMCYLDFVENFYPELQLVPWRTEFKMVLLDKIEHNGTTVTYPVACGTIDLIMRDKLGRFFLFDWKRVDPKSKGKLGKRKASNASTSFPDPDALGFLKSYKSDAFTKYSAQLLAYRYIFEKMYLTPGQEVAGSFIVQIHPDLPQAHGIEAAEGLNDDFEYCVYECMDDEVQRARGERRALLDGPNAHYIHDADF